MKVVRSLDPADNKKLDKLIELEPDLIKMVEEYKAKNKAGKISKPLLISLILLAVTGFVLYVLPAISASGVAP